MLKTRIEAEFIAAFKAKDTLKKDTLGIVKSKIVEWSKSNAGKDITDADIIAILASEVKKRRETIDMYSIDNATERMLKNRLQYVCEVAVLETFLPKQLTEDEIVAEIDKIKATNPARLMPAVMQHFSKNFKGQYDAKKLQDFLKN